MAKPRVFIDGQAGTTGLRIGEMLSVRSDIELLSMPAAERKDIASRARFLNAADLAILCLPDEAAAGAIELVSNPGTKILDTSTAHRVDPEWTYGLPELGDGQRQKIATSMRVANPGCYPTGFILALRPLVAAGMVLPSTQLTVNAASGYSGGGKRMIEAYSSLPPVSRSVDAVRPLALYGLDGRHKHLAEMQKFSLIASPPLFVPSVAPVFCGMTVSTPIPRSSFVQPNTTRAVHEVWKLCYGDAPMVELRDPDDSGVLREGRFLDLDDVPRRNGIELMVFGDTDIGLVLVARLDNLGKGAAGNAVQCLNLMLGSAETTGL